MSSEKENKKIPENKNDEQNREISLEEASEVNGGVIFSRTDLKTPFSKLLDKAIFRRTDN